MADFCEFAIEIDELKAKRTYKEEKAQEEYVEAYKKALNSLLERFNATGVVTFDLQLGTIHGKIRIEPNDTEASDYRDKPCVLSFYNRHGCRVIFDMSVSLLNSCVPCKQPRCNTDKCKYNAMGYCFNSVAYPTCDIYTNPKDTEVK